MLALHPDVLRRGGAVPGSIRSGHRAHPRAASAVGGALLPALGLEVGDIIEVQLVAQVAGRAADDTLTMATRGTIVWLRDREGAIVFDAPLAY